MQFRVYDKYHTQNSYLNIDVIIFEFCIRNQRLVIDIRLNVNQYRKFYKSQNQIKFFIQLTIVDKDFNLYGGYFRWKNYMNHPSRRILLGLHIIGSRETNNQIKTVNRIDKASFKSY
ncbi:hypothetical protein ABPG72_004927 [Tetrahymena utriculariae]